MIILRIIEILLRFERVWNRRRTEVLMSVDPGERLGSLLFWKLDHFSFHGKAGFHHICQMNRIHPAFLSLFLPHQTAMTP
jgi:hypothetical protein